MDNNLLTGHTKTGTLAGTFLVLFLNINLENLAGAAIVAATGATVSFFVSVFWKFVAGKMRRK
jgi:hypothetical protein